MFQLSPFKLNFKSVFTLVEGATHVAMLPVEHRRSFIDVISAKVCSKVPTPAEEGFTLAEVLITLGIIGVVAAMTIPGLINNYKAQRLRTQFLKSYSTITQVYKTMQNDNENSVNSEYEHASFYKNFSNYLQSPLDCGNYYEKRNNQKPCYAPNANNNVYKSLDGTVLGNPGERLLDDGILVLQDGTILYFENNKEGDSAIYISVDLNGIGSGPNVWGYDLFTFQFLDAVNVKPMGDVGTDFSEKEYCDINKKSSLNGIACSNKAKNDPAYFKKIIKTVK